MDIDHSNAIELGDRLRVAREAARLTQAMAAAELGLARTTLVAIEKGQRRTKIEELQGFARLYDTSVNTLLRRESVYVDLVPRFRALHTGDDRATDAAAQLLADLVRAEIELENLLGITRPRSYPPERPLLPGDVRFQAENSAAELRQWLGLGPARVRDLVTILELDIGIRLYMRPLDPHVSGLFAYDDTNGACMLLNANHPPERRNQSIGHELGHFIATRRVPEVLCLDEAERSREESYANAFGRAFLTPARTVMEQFHHVTAGSSRLTRRHVILLAHVFGVSREAMVRRLEELGLAKPGTWVWFQENGGITDAQARQVLGDLASPDPDPGASKSPATIRLNALAAEAWRQGLMSEGQLGRLLRMDRVALRELLDTVEIEGSEDVGPKLPG